jgi:hypothetical protein
LLPYFQMGELNAFWGFGWQFKLIEIQPAYPPGRSQPKTIVRIQINRMYFGTYQSIFFIKIEGLIIINLRIIGSWNQ